MPELPEVETVRRELRPRLVGRRILEVVLHRRDVVIAPGDPAGGHSRQRSERARRPTAKAAVSAAGLLQGVVVNSLERRGKQLAIVGEAEGGLARTMVVQLGMTGQLLWEDAAGAPDGGRGHVHAIWRLQGGERMLFRDPRRFGALRVLPTREALEALWSRLGPDALTVTGEDLVRAAAARRCAIKALLLDQGAIAGVGNIYADESLFLAGINPYRPAETLGPEDCARLAGAVRRVLEEGITGGGSSVRDFVGATALPGRYQDQHRVYGRAGEPCMTCRRVLLGDRLCQRATVWCGACQA